MYVEDKRMKNRDRTLFVFYFTDEEDANFWFELLEEVVNSFPEEEKYSLLYLKDKIKSRMDGKYAKEDAQLTSCLFQDEASLFIQKLLAGLFYYQIKIKSDYLDLLNNLLKKTERKD